MRKAAALLTAMVLMLSLLLTGCGNTEASAGFDKENVYKTEILELENALSTITRVFPAGEKIYAMGYLEKPLSGTDGEALIEINLETGEEKMMIPPKTEDGFIFTIGADQKGDICYIENVYTWNEENPDESANQFFFQVVTPEMEEKSRIELVDMGEFYPENMAFDKDGNIYLGAFEGMQVYSPDGKKIFEELGNPVRNLITDSQGNVIITDYDIEKTRLETKKVDISKKEMMELETMKSFSESFEMAVGDENYPLYVNDGNAVYGFDSDNGEREFLLNWVNCDVNGSDIQEFHMLPDGKILALYNGGITGKQEIQILTKVDPADVTEKQVLTLAGLYDDYDVKNAVIAFNKQSEKYRIVLKDYAGYVTEENPNGGVEQLNKDLASDKAPDIINLHSLDAEAYVSEGLLEDLYPLVEEETENKEEDSEFLIQMSFAVPAKAENKEGAKEFLEFMKKHY